MTTYGHLLGDENRFNLGDRVWHRNLELEGTVVGNGSDPGYSVVVEFEDEETRDVSTGLLDRL